MTESSAPKHGGCSDCGSKADPILTSVIDTAGVLQSKAVCSKCLPKYPEGCR